MLKKTYLPDSDKANTTKEKIDRHLKDINDTISEEDISQIGIDAAAENRIIINNGVIEIPDKKSDNLNDKSDNKKETEKSVLNPWNIVS